jgi:hypothetical protein
MIENLVTVNREGPIIITDYDTTPNLLEAMAAMAGVLVGDPEVSPEVQVIAATLISAIRFPDLKVPVRSEP